MKKFAILILAIICVNVVMAQPRPMLRGENDTQGIQILEIQIQIKPQ